MMEILLEQCRAGCRIRHYPVPAAFGVLATNAKDALGWINIIGMHAAKFLPPQCRIVGECEHHTIANRLLACSSENRVPVRFVRNPRQPPVPANEHSPTIVHDGVLATKTFIHKMTVEKSEYGYPLLNGC